MRRRAGGARPSAAWSKSDRGRQRLSHLPYLWDQGKTHRNRQSNGGHQGGGGVQGWAMGRRSQRPRRRRNEVRGPGECSITADEALSRPRNSLSVDLKCSHLRRETVTLRHDGGAGRRAAGRTACQRRRDAAGKKTKHWPITFFQEFVYFVYSTCLRCGDAITSDQRRASTGRKTEIKRREKGIRNRRREGGRREGAGRLWEGASEGLAWSEVT